MAEQRYVLTKKQADDLDRLLKQQNRSSQTHPQGAVVNKRTAIETYVAHLPSAISGMASTAQGWSPYGLTADVYKLNTSTGKLVDTEWAVDAYNLGTVGASSGFVTVTRDPYSGKYFFENDQGDGSVIALVKASTNASTVTVEFSSNLVTGEPNTVVQASNPESLYWFLGEQVLIIKVGVTWEIVGCLDAYSLFIGAVSGTGNQGSKTATINCTIKGLSGVPVIFESGEFKTLNVEDADSVHVIARSSASTHLRELVCIDNVSDEPVGTIRMTNKTTANRGWHICDGTGGTNDMRIRVPVGYHSGNVDYNEIYKTGGNATHTHDGHINHRHALDTSSDSIPVTTPGDSTGIAVNGSPSAAVWTAGVDHLAAGSGDILAHAFADGRDPYITINFEIRIASP